MTNVKPASASEFIEFMREGAETFRPDWDTCGLVLSQAHYLAGFLARYAGAFPAAEAVPLFEIGSVLLLLADREDAARAQAANMIRGNGGEA